jgi:hypothetical protein
VATKQAADAIRVQLENATEAPPDVDFDAEFQDGATALLDGLFGARDR